MVKTRNEEELETNGELHGRINIKKLETERREEEGEEGEERGRKHGLVNNAPRDVLIGATNVK